VCLSGGTQTDITCLLRRRVCQLGYAEKWRPAAQIMTHANVFVNRQSHYPARR
jgi:hypothetical protein